MRTAAGQRTTVRVTAKALSGTLGAWTVDVSYDRKSVKIAGCKAATGSVCNVAFAEGIVRISGASASGLSGQQTLATLTVEGIGSSDRASPLKLSVETLTSAEGEPLPAATNASR